MVCPWFWDQTIYVKMPFVDDRSATELRRFAVETGLPLKLAFSTAKPLSLQLRKSYPLPCPRDCFCHNEGLCNKKNVVYGVSCLKCQRNQTDYAGETHRTVHRRIYEHTLPDSHVFQHFQQSHPGVNIKDNITVKVLAGGFQDTMHRIAYETSTIKDYQPPFNVQGT